MFRKLLKGFLSSKVRQTLVWLPATLLETLVTSQGDCGDICLTKLLWGLHEKELEEPYWRCCKEGLCVVLRGVWSNCQVPSAVLWAVALSRVRGPWLTVQTSQGNLREPVSCIPGTDWFSKSGLEPWNLHFWQALKSLMKVGSHFAGFSWLIF